MTVRRMDHVGIVVDDLDAAIAFFTELGLEVQNRMSVDGSWVDACRSSSARSRSTRIRTCCATCAGRRASSSRSPRRLAELRMTARYAAR